MVYILAASRLYRKISGLFFNAAIRRKIAAPRNAFQFCGHSGPDYVSAANPLVIYWHHNHIKTRRTAMIRHYFGEC